MQEDKVTNEEELVVKREFDTHVLRSLGRTQAQSCNLYKLIMIAKRNNVITFFKIT